MKTSIKSLLQTAVMISAVLTTACSDSENPMNKKTDPSFEGVVWRLADLSGKTVRSSNDAKPATITFDPTSGQVSGFSGVNQFHGSYKIDGPAISFGPVVSTRMAGPPELMEIESEFLKFVSTDATFEAADGNLTLKLGDGAQAHFVPLAE